MSVNQDKSLWRLATSTGIKVKLLKRRGGFSRDGAEATEEYIVKSEDLMDFVNVGLPTPSAYYGIVYPGRAVMYGVPSLVVDKITFESLTDGKPVDPFGADTSAPEGTYEENLKAVVTYAPREKGKDSEDSDPNDPTSFLQISAQGSGEFLAPEISGKATWWDWEWIWLDPYDSDDRRGYWKLAEVGEVKEVNIPATIKVSMTEWSVSWPQTPHDYYYGTILPKLRAAIGTVNLNQLALLHNPPPHTILLSDFSTNEEYLWDLGDVKKPPISLEMHFTEKNFLAPFPSTDDRPTEEGATMQVTHQHFYRPGVGWQVLKVEENFIYAATDHSLIWKA